MKCLLLTALVLSMTSTSFAASTVATCELLHNGVVRDHMVITLSDNGDEGVLHFKSSKLEFADNIQDDYASFLKPGVSKLYVSYEGAQHSDGRKINSAAVFLKNDDGIITGLLKADFLEYDLRCEAMKYLM